MCAWLPPTLKGRLGGVQLILVVPLLLLNVGGSAILRNTARRFTTRLFAMPRNVRREPRDHDRWNVRCVGDLQKLVLTLIMIMLVASMDARSVFVAGSAVNAISCWGMPTMIQSFFVSLPTT
jgi:hypothetical protein